MKPFITLDQVKKRKVDARSRFYSASHDEIDEGLTADVYFVRTQEILEAKGYGDVAVTAEIFASREGVLAGVEEACYLLRQRDLEIWHIPEGERIAAGEVVMRLRGLYRSFGILETALLGILASSSGWATAARECKEAAQGQPVYCFRARHLHPAVASVMDRAAVIGGADGCSSILGALLLGASPVGTVPHAAFLIVEDTVEMARAYHELMPPETPRIILVDTFKDEAEEALRVAEALKSDLQGIRLDTPGERGGVTPGLVREVRARLNQAGYPGVKIMVSGGLDPERISALAAAGADSFGVGSYIARAPAIDMTMDLKEIQGRPIAKRGRIPGIAENPRLVKSSRA